LSHGKVFQAVVDVQEIAKGVPSDFELVSQRKGFKRFMTAELRDFVKQRAEALEKKEMAMAGILQACLFCHIPTSLLDATMLSISHDLF